MALRPLICLLVLAVLVAAPAGAAVPPKPPGAAPLRFRDEVFRHIKVGNGIVYGRAPGLDGKPEDLELDLYRPRGDHLARRPAMIWVHGGGFAIGTRSHPTLRKLALGSARRGFVSVSVDYRILAKKGCLVSDPACRQIAIADQHDVQAAVRWLRRNAARYRIDPTRIAVGGTSVGGVLSYMVATRAGDPGDSGNPGYSSAVRCFVSIAGGYPGGLFATPGDAPGLLFHGRRDAIHPFAWSVDAARALRRAGVAVTLEPLDTQIHVGYAVFRALYDHHTAWFLFRQLGLRALMRQARQASM
jgi:acetyl esterase/lipase